jgi:hypothetical protein
LPTPPADAAYWAPPSELGAHGYDPFYAPLSTRLAEGNLSDALRRRLDAYQAMKVALQSELLGKLASLSSADPEARTAGLAAYAREQTPRLVALEKTAEDLRDDFLRTGLVALFSGTGDWNEYRTWRVSASQLGDNRDSLTRKFQVARAAVYYQDGLSPAQRRLLREIAVELQAQAFMPAGSASASDGTLFFSPDTARVRLPKDLPPALADRVAAYQAEKTRLKAELRDTLFQQDKASKGARAQALKQLAATQASRLSRLETMADEIRPELAAEFLRRSAVPGIALPSALAGRLVIYHEGRRKLQEAMRTTLQEIGRILPPTDFTVSQSSTEPSREFSLSLEFARTVSSEKRRQVLQTIDRFNREHRDEVATLQQQQLALRAAMTEFIATHPEAARGKSVDSLLQDNMAASIETGIRPLYETYRVAVLQPGLSPEQRRLLFDAALRQLDLPLPAGELQP